MYALYDSLFVNPSLEALIPIILSLVIGMILSFFKRLMMIGVTIVAIGVCAFILYFVFTSGVLHL